MEPGAEGGGVTVGGGVGCLPDFLPAPGEDFGGVMLAGLPPAWLTAPTGDFLLAGTFLLLLLLLF